MFINDLDQAPLEQFDSLDSTMTKAAEAYAVNREEGLTVIAQHQSAGRGRRGRQWISASGGGLWATMVLRPSRPASDWPSLGIVFAVSLAQTLESLTQKQIQLKWPNDLWFAEKKLAGILMERIDDGSALALGFGVNFSSPQNDDSQALRQPPIGLDALVAELPSPEILLRQIRRNFSAPYNGWTLGSWETTKAEFGARDVLKGCLIQWEQDQETRRGTAEGIDTDGQLRVKLANGEMTQLLAAEVEKISTQS